MNDKIFGELEYDFIWYKDININFGGKEVDIVLMINGDEDGEFEEEQYTAYNALMKAWDDVEKEILEAVLSYYNQKRHELGYDINEDESYPLIQSREDLLEHISLVGIVIPYSGAYDGRECGVTFDCTWDEENGVGVRLVDERVLEVGYQDVVM